MDLIDTLLSRNAAYAKEGFHPELKIIPSQRMLILGCVDPRVDPLDILKLQPGEAAIIRNVGGRATPSLLETMALLRAVSKAGGQEIGTGFNLVVLHHTDCGIIGCYHHARELLAKHMGVASADLDALAVTDPRTAVAVDVAALKANPMLPGGLTVSGLVYDVANGRVEVIVPPALLRPA